MKPVKSQWDFGELFPREELRKIHSVSELTGRVRRLLESQIGLIWVSGEVTNLRIQSSGHAYFTLKDATAQISCVLFRGEYQADRSALQDGRKVLLQGELTVYEARGQYQLRVTQVELEGVGALQAAFEKLKLKLQQEGLFATERKRPLPRFPRVLGLVTSPTGAAIKDVVHVIERRNPSLKILLAACRVQGAGASTEIAEAIGLLNEYHERRQQAGQPGIDLILVTRGGGSLEDLWAFNEEAVARAIHASGLPVVSAVGHEIDFTISDFVADFRAATPSAAAEIITEGFVASCQFIGEASERLEFLVHQQLEDKRSALSQVQQRFSRAHPRRRLEMEFQRVDDLQTSLARCLKQSMREKQQGWRTLADRLARVRPALVLRGRRDLLHQESQRLGEVARHRVQQLRSRVDALQARLRLLGPEQVLARGYSITTDACTGAVVRSSDELAKGQLLRTRLNSGSVLSRVEGEDQPGATAG